VWLLERWLTHSPADLNLERSSGNNPNQDFFVALHCLHIEFKVIHLDSLEARLSVPTRCNYW